MKLPTIKQAPYKPSEVSQYVNDITTMQTHRNTLIGLLHGQPRSETHALLNEIADTNNTIEIMQKVLRILLEKKL